MRASKLMSMDIDEAKEKLDDDEFEKWEEIHENMNEAKEKMGDRQTSSGAKTMINAYNRDKKQTLELFDKEITILMTLDRKQSELLNKLSKYSNKQLSEIDAEKHDDLIFKCASFLSEITADDKFDIGDWIEITENVGLRGSFDIIKQITDAIKEEMEGVEQFRS